VCAAGIQSVWGQPVKILVVPGRFVAYLRFIGLTLMSLSGLSHANAQEDSDCTALARVSFAGIQVATAEAVASAHDFPAYCRVIGKFEPSIGFEMRMPMDSWNQRFLMSGCGAYCGEVEPDRKGYANSINYALKRGYAATTTDSGHQAGRTDTSWAFNNREAERLYAHGWVPLAAAGSHLILEAFYGARERYSYFSGCSNGGRTALKVAQLYPDLFDGIASGCPTVNLTEAAGIQGVFLDRTLVDGDGELILRAEKIPMLSQAVRDRCDSLDGLTDGLVSDPKACDFDPELLKCHKDTDDIGCLTTAEVRQIRSLYAGAVDSRGKSLHYGMPYGSEPYWEKSLVGATDSGQHYLADFGSNFLRYLGFEQDPGHEYSSSQFDLDRDIPQLAFMGSLYNVGEPRLKRLQHSDGKLLMYHGMADPLIMYQQSVGFYNQVVGEAGSPEKVDEFFRLFLIPGSDHCWANTGLAPDLFDPLEVLERWVEMGQAPKRIDAIQHADTGASEGVGPVLRSRPLCPYPEISRYTGAGSAYSASSFECAMPE